jgi:hypothetical protein
MLHRIRRASGHRVVDRSQLNLVDAKVVHVVSRLVHLCAYLRYPLIDRPVGNPADPASRTQSAAVRTAAPRRAGFSWGFRFEQRAAEAEVAGVTGKVIQTNE